MTQQQQEHHDWHFGPGAVTFCAIMGTLFATMFANDRGIGWPWALLAGLATAILAIIASLYTRDPDTNTEPSIITFVFRAACMMGLGVWSSVQLATVGPLSGARFLGWLVNSALTLAIAGTVAGIVAVFLRRRDRRIAMDDHTRRLIRANSRKRYWWQDGLRTVTRNTALQVVKLEMWRNAAGFRLTVDLRATTITWQDINSHAGVLATRANLNLGCGVEAFTGPSRGFAYVDVSEVNRLAERIMYPRDWRPSSIYNAKNPGIYRSGDLVEFFLRENSWITFGQKRSGKTTHLQVMSMELAKCTDVILLGIDYNGGGFTLPLNAAWAEGLATRPVFDWVAPDVDEAELLVDFLLAVAIDRKTAFRERKRQANLTLLPLDETLPAYFLIIDEGAEAMGPKAKGKAARVRDKLEQLQRMAGDSGINVGFSFLRGVADHVDPAVVAACAVRTTFRVSTSVELAYVYGDYKLSPEDAPYQGSGHVLAGHGQSTRVWKGYDTDPEQMEEFSIVSAAWRPTFDERAIEVGGREVWEGRWRRTGWMFTRDAKPPVPAQRTPAAPQRELVTVTVAAGVGGAGDPSDAEIAAAGRAPDLDDIPSMEAAVAQAEKARAALAATGGEQVLDGEDQQAFARMVADNFDTPENWPQLARPASLDEDLGGEKVLEVLILNRGLTGGGWSDLHRDLTAGGEWGPPVDVTIQTMGKWLGKQAFEKGGYLRERGDRAPYVHKQAR